MTVKVGGEQLWNWNVMDSETRYILASHLSPYRDKRAAVAVMRKAAETASEPPKTVKTDKLTSYAGAINDVFPEAIHIESQGIRAFTNNKRSERLQGTFRQRTKTLLGLGNIETRQRYLDGWTLDYNLFKEHESLDFKTPAEAANVNPPFREWEDVVKASSRDDRPRLANIRDARARLADVELPPLEKRPGVHFVGFDEKKRRRRHHDPLAGVPQATANPKRKNDGGKAETGNRPSKPVLVPGRE